MIQKMIVWRVNDMRVIDLFCGSGGLSSGFSKYFDVETAVDWNADAAATYGRNHKYTDVLEVDVRDLDYSKRDYDGIVGVIGGPPCQDFSVLNKHSNPDSQRADLLYQMLRATEEIKPQFVLIENVASVPKSKKQEVIDFLTHAGYNVVSRVVYASWYGSVQKRRRWILVANKGRSIYPSKSPNFRTAADILTGEISEIRARQSTLDKIQDLESGKWVAAPGQSFKVYYIVDPTKKLPAIVNPTKLRYVRPDRTGYLSFGELERAMGFPDDYEFVGNLTSRGQQLANAVPVEMASAFAKEIMQCT